MIMNWICTNFKVKTTVKTCNQTTIYDLKDEQQEAPRIYIMEGGYGSLTMVEDELPLQIREFLQIAAGSTPPSLDLQWIDEENKNGWRFSSKLIRINVNSY